MAVLDPATSRQQYDDFYRRSLDDPEAFWLEAAEPIDWSAPPERAFEQPSPPTFRGSPAAGRTCTVNALDRHVAAGARRPDGAHRAQRARRAAARSPTPSCCRGRARRRGAARRSASARATASRSTCRPAPRRSSRCSRPSASARSTRSSSPASARGALGDRIRGERLAARPHRRRHLPQGQGRRALADRRRGARRRCPSDGRARRRPAAPRRRGADCERRATSTGTTSSPAGDGQ